MQLAKLKNRVLPKQQRLKKKARRIFLPLLNLKSFTVAGKNRSKINFFRYVSVLIKKSQPKIVRISRLSKTTQFFQLSNFSKAQGENTNKICRKLLVASKKKSLLLSSIFDVFWRTSPFVFFNRIGYQLPLEKDEVIKKQQQLKVLRKQSLRVLSQQFGSIFNARRYFFVRRGTLKKNKKFVPAFNNFLCAYLQRGIQVEGFRSLNKVFQQKKFLKFKTVRRYLRIKNKVQQKPYKSARSPF